MELILAAQRGRIATGAGQSHAEEKDMNETDEEGGWHRIERETEQPVSAGMLSR